MPTKVDGDDAGERADDVTAIVFRLRRRGSAAIRPRRRKQLDAIAPVHTAAFQPKLT